jgi:hypothetical protein
MVKAAGDNVGKPRKKTNPKLTDEERHARFIAMAHEVEAGDNPEAFDAAFDKVTGGKGKPPGEARRPGRSKRQSDTA